MVKKRILFIVESLGGGVFTYIVDLANELVKTYDIYIAYATRKQTPADFLNYFDNRIHLIKVRNFVRSINPIRDVKAFFEIKKIADDVQPDIVHLHSSKAGVLGRWAFNGKRTPLFYTPHGYSFLMKNQNAVKRLIYKTIEILSGFRHCTTICCSEGEYQESLKLTKRSLYVNNGINTDKLQRVLETLDKTEKHPFTVFTLGRICAQKNPVLFNKIALAMPDIKFLWIGDGELRSELTAPNIEITGWVERNAALQQSLKGDVFMLTSLWEGLPISLLEAMYMKKYCVVSDVIGNRDVIHDRENGFTCQNVDDFVKAICFILDGGCSQLPEIAYCDIVNKYNITVMAEKYNEIYLNKLR